MDLHRLGELRSIRYHRAIADRLEREPAIVVRARERVRQWLREGTVAREYALAWDAVLTGTQGEIAAFLVGEGEWPTAMRQASPFAGVLDPRDRWRLWRAVQP